MGEATEKVANVVPGHEVRDHRLPAGGDEVEAEERLGPAVQGGRGRLPRRLHGRPVREGPGRRPGRSRRSAASRSRRSTPTSPATRRAPRTRTRTSRSLFGYSQDFVDQAKCKEIALNQIAEGSQVVFAVAGGCGLGALDAAKEKGKQGIGVDADQAYLGDHIMTSALKKVDEAAFTAAQEVQDGSFKAGHRHDLRRQVRRRRLRQDERRGRPSTRSRSTRRWRRSSPARSPTSRPSPPSSPDRTEPPARPRAEGRHQALRRARRERQRRPRPAPRRGARPARGERGGQVDAHERPLRAAPARRGRDPPPRRAGRRSARRARRSACGSAWCTSTSC